MGKNWESFFKGVKCNFAIDGISNDGIKTFFTLYFGLLCFMHNEKMILIKKDVFENEIKNIEISNEDKTNIFGSLSLRLKMLDSESEYTKYALLDNKNKQIILLLHEKENDYIVHYISQIVDYDELCYEYEDEKILSYNLKEEIIKLLLDVSHDNYTQGEHHKDLILLKDIYNIRSDWNYHFIIGSGVNFGFEMDGWKELDDKFCNTINNILRENNICSKINDKTFNTNYGSFQILKDININIYHNLLDELVTPNIMTLSSGKTMQAIVNIINHQKSKMNNQKVLTFNYDTVLEYHLGTSNVKSVYRYDKSIENNLINVIHSHGLLPFIRMEELSHEKYYDSIVLTSNEYFEQYSSKSAYAYSELYNFLDETCFFIGNSIKDHEEQKVISEHFKKNPSQFHFAFFSREEYPDEIVLLYKTVFLLKMGVIPLWYSNHDSYIDELNLISEQDWSEI